MTWTSVPPNRPGWYWVRSHRWEGAVMGEVFVNPLGTLSVVVSRAEPKVFAAWQVGDDCYAAPVEWCGPLELPHE